MGFHVLRSPITLRSYSSSFVGFFSKSHNPLLSGKIEFLSGVAEEVREIEWPAFQKVLGTTGVVLGVIAGSSVVLLTVNFLLAQLSDGVFIGKGVQDFFS